MKFIVKLFIISIASYFLQLAMPWYSIAIMPFLVGAFFSGKARGAFFAGFLAIALLWGTLAMMIHYQSGGVLSIRIAELFKVGSPALLILLTAFTGGLVGGLWGWTGYALRSLFVKRKRASGRYDIA